MHQAGTSCPSCGGLGLETFYEQQSVPVHSCRLVATREEAKAFQTGALQLGVCTACGFISNIAFDPTVQDYFVAYEETQAFSPRFQEFMGDLAARWIDRHDLRGKTVLEIGSGKGEFLLLMSELGGNRGIGIDPGFDPARVATETIDVDFVKDYYSDRYAHLNADAVICRHTLEHIQDVSGLLGLVRRYAARENSVLLFELPDVWRVLREVAFWDIYYEHVSYFTPGSLARAFRRAGFEVVDLALDYDDQYILIEGRLSTNTTEPPSHPLEESVDDVVSAARQFSAEFAHHHSTWVQTLASAHDRGERVVLWGAGSKAVAFLTTLGTMSHMIEYAVDINPHKQGTFLAGVGQQIVQPDFLRDYRPTIIIAMNPVYLAEIRAALTELGVEATLEAV
jgi:SAM-dependent methyltransferase